MGTCHILPQHATRSPLSSFARVVLADLLVNLPGTSTYYAFLLESVLSLATGI